MKTFIATAVIMALFMLSLALGLLIRGKPVIKKCCAPEGKPEAPEGGCCCQGGSPDKKSGCCA